MGLHRNAFAPVKESQIGSFLAAVDGHVDAQEIEIRCTGYCAEVLARNGKYLQQWSNLRHFGHPSARKRRNDLHRNIVDKLLTTETHKNGSRPTAIIVVGPPGSGKTSKAVPMAEAKFGLQFSKVNPDDVKELLPEYEGWNASALHDESAELAELHVEREAVKSQRDFIYDITGRTATKVESAMQDFEQYGYRVVLMLTDLPCWKAAARAWDRFQLNPFQRDLSLPPGRFVPPRYVYTKVKNRPRRTFDKLKNRPQIKAYCHLNMDVPVDAEPQVIDEKGW